MTLIAKSDPPVPRSFPSARPPWATATAVSSLQDAWQSDAELLETVLPLRQLAGAHPIREWWETPTSAARFEIHQLADDLRMIRGVDGEESLLGQVRANLVRFKDFRFELRLAGALARSSGQKLLRLGGDHAGPDIEVVLRSGHRAGIACYRASSEVPAIQDLRASIVSHVRAFSATILAGASVDQLLAITFPRFPVNADDAGLARALLRRVLRSPEQPVHEDGGFRISRHTLPRNTRTPTETLRVRLRFQFPVPSWEKERVEDRVLSKGKREARSWAKAFNGLAIFALEESLFGQDMLDKVAAVVSEQSPFHAVVTSFPAVVPDDDGVHHGLDDINCHFSKTLSVPGKIDIGIETFGDNVGSWSKDHGLVCVTDDCVSEDWDISRGPHGATIMRSQALQMYRAFSRVPFTAGVPPESDPAMPQKVADAVIRLRNKRP